MVNSPLKPIKDKVLDWQLKNYQDIFKYYNQTKGNVFGNCDAYEQPCLHISKLYHFKHTY